MLCDWLTLRYELRTEADIALRDRLLATRDICYRVRGGEIVTAWAPRESVGTDTHRVVVGVGLGSITIEGSPARLRSASNVFGSGDPSKCAADMIAFASRAVELPLPSLSRWRATRIDLTQNYDCGPHVREALDSLSRVSGGHLRCDARQKYSVSWNPGSDFWSAIAYAKGPHLERQCRRGVCEESDRHIELAQRLLRFEVRLRNHYLRRSGIEIQAFDEAAALEHFVMLASKILPSDGCAITGEQQFAERVAAMFGPRRARTLLGTWALIRQVGETAARERLSRSTWYRDQRDLFAAGLCRADFSSAQIIAFRPRAIAARPVDSWADLERAA